MRRHPQRKTCPTCSGRGFVKTPVEIEVSYEAEVRFVTKTIRDRGKIWEGCRPAFESGDYYDSSLDRLLKEGVIVPSDDPDGGYVLP